MLLERLQDPASKRANFLNQHEYVNMPKVELHHLYRALDKLDAHSNLIQKQIYQTKTTESKWQWWKPKTAINQTQKQERQQQKQKQNNDVPDSYNGG